MAKNTDKQIVDNFTDNFLGYVTLLCQIKQRVQYAVYDAVLQ